MTSTTRIATVAVPALRDTPGTLRIAGIGASAGGLEALRELFRELPAAPGLCVVVVQHLSPTHRSMLVSLLAREAQLPVLEIEDGMSLQPDTIHITPPACHVRISRGQLRLTPALTAGTPKPSVNDFFSSLAEAYGPQAIGIILSGTGHDGAEGIRQIEAAGGTTVVQDPATARYDGMPAAAMGTGQVHHVLAPALIGSNLHGLWPRRLAIVQGDSALVSEDPPLSPDPLERISDFMRRMTGVEIRLYKENTLMRRLNRRLASTGCADLAAYAQYLFKAPQEMTLLKRELLISVTHFFRDPLAFGALREAIETLVRARADRDELRVWIAGCAGGEEAYSVALLIAEAQRNLGRVLTVRIFATDLDEDAIDRARRARYTAESLTRVPASLLERYFTRDGAVYQAVKPVREMLIFSVHNLTGDPAFSRLDLISCRNVLIYFRPELQTHLLESFRNALVPYGVLFLGKSESLQHGPGLFQTLDEKHRLFQRGEASVNPGALRRDTPRSVQRPPPRVLPRDRISVFERVVRAGQGSLLPPSVLVDTDLGVRHVFGDVSPWIKLGDGEFASNLYHLAERPLRVELRSLALRAQRDEKGFVEHTVQSREQLRPVRLSVLRLDESEGQPELLLVSFHATRSRKGAATVRSDGSAANDSEVANLELQLASTREHLHTVIEELETSNEELQSLNEEMQSSNEELTSSNEELETTNEELQSTNEELTTVNEELENKSQELELLNSDLLNVKNSLPHPLLVVDLRGCVALFNDSAAVAFALTPQSVGLPLFALPALQEVLGDLTELAGNLRQVTDGGDTVERQVEAGRSGWLTMAPYHNDAGACTGAVIVLIDNTTLRAAERDLLAANHRLQETERFARETIDSMPSAVCVIDADCRIVSINQQWRDVMEGSAAQPSACGIGANYAEVCARAARQGEPVAQAILDGMQAVVGGRLANFVQEYRCTTPQGERWFSVSVTPFSRQKSQHWLVMHMDITDRMAQARTIQLQSYALAADSGGVFIADASVPHVPIVYANPAFEQVTGLPVAEVLGRDFTLLFSGFEGVLRQAVADGRAFCTTIQLARPDGMRHAELSVSLINHQPFESPHFVGVLHDVTERVSVAESLSSALAHENLALSFAEIGTLEWLVRPGKLACSALQMQLLGFPAIARELPSEAFRNRIHPDDLAAFDEALRFCLAGLAAFSLDFRVVWHDGSVHWLRCRGNAKVDALGTPTSLLCLTQDITSAKESELRARFLAHHDSLTGLANRSLLEDRLQQSIISARRERRRVAVVFLDLDRFKEINDVMGHQAGDDVLVQTATRLVDAIRQSDSVCRYSGDEFIVLLPGIHDADEATRVVAKLTDALRQPYPVGGRELSVTASVGVSIFPEDGDSPDALIRNADTAMYQAKTAGRNGFEFYSQSMNVRHVRQIETTAHLRHCIAQDQLELHYQPQVQVQDGSLVGIEALLRWRHPERGLLLPDEFIPDAEDADLIHEIGAWVLERACRQHMDWIGRGLARVPMAVNVSPLQLHRADFVERLHEVLTLTGLAPELLEIEITERILINQTDSTLTTLAACRALGVRFSIDDFGTGHSSLTYLLRVPVERIKIDRSFVGVSDQQETAASIVRGVIQLGHGLRQTVVAEGVETPQQLALLRNEGCDAYQGYLCSPPLTAEEFQRFAKLPAAI